MPSIFRKPPMPCTSTTAARGAAGLSSCCAGLSGGSAPPQPSAKTATIQARLRMPDPRAAGRMPHPSIDRCCPQCYFAESILENDSPTVRTRFPSTKEAAMAQLKGSKTHENLKSAFAGESQANRRYLYFAKQAD